MRSHVCQMPDVILGHRLQKTYRRLTEDLQKTYRRHKTIFLLDQHQALLSYIFNFSGPAPCIGGASCCRGPNKVKVIPQNIYELLTPVALAHWIKGDGVSRRHGLTICTDSYTLTDIIRLMNVLILRYELECTLQYHTPSQPRINIRQRSSPALCPARLVHHTQVGQGGG